MVQLSAQDAVSQLVCKVSADMRLKDVNPYSPYHGYEAYAVFSDVVQTIPDTQYLGIVPKHMVGRYPYRIFADLLPFSKSTVVEPHASLDGLYEEFQQRSIDAFAVMRDDRQFVGVVTPTSLLRTLWQREQVLTARLQQEIAGKLSAEHQLEKVKDELETHLEQRVDLQLDHASTLKALSDRLLSTEARERKALAGELHDHLAQLLTLGRMTVSQGLHQTQEPGMRKVLQAVDELLGESLSYTRSLMSELSSAHLQSGLLSALESLAQKMKSFGLNIRLEATHTLPPLTEDQKTLLYWSLRELVFNIVKHAGVREAELVIQSPDPRSIQCSVSDKGRGIDMTQIFGHVSRNDHFGLSSIRARLHAHGGKMDIHSTPGQGTVVTLFLPLAH